jgi:hypothetical protein
MNGVEEIISQTGYKITKDDEPYIELIRDTVVQEILNFTNRTVIPAELEDVVDLRTAGRFLSAKASTGQLGDDFDFSGALQAVSEGDSSFTFRAGYSVEEMFKDYIMKMGSAGTADLADFRRMRW